MSEKVVVITGASGVFGRALAKEFAGQGWLVVGTGRSDRPAELPEGIEYRQFDAGNAAECEAFWTWLQEKRPDTQLCLVNNAGGYITGSLTETTPEGYEDMMRSCYFSSVYMTRGLALSFATARIINIVSSSALRSHKNNSAYGAAKAAQMHFAQSLQEEFKADKYRITNLYPNFIGPEAGATDPEDLAAFVYEQAANDKTYYIRDVTLYPV